MPLPLTVSCFSKIQIGFTFLVPAHPGSPRKRSVKRVCVCVCACACVLCNKYSILSCCVGSGAVARQARLRRQAGAEGGRVGRRRGPVRGQSGAERRVEVPRRAPARRAALPRRDGARTDVTVDEQGHPQGRRRLHDDAQQPARNCNLHHQTRRSRYRHTFVLSIPCPPLNAT